MRQDQIYTFLLDLFPLTDEVVQGSPVLGDALQRTALGALLRNAAGETPTIELSQLRILLSLSRDLGFASPEVVLFLDNSLARLAEGSA